jgi:hypothetical protein
MHYIYYPGSSIAQIVAYRARKTLRSSLLYLRDRLRHSSGYARLRALRGSARGRSAFVFANGPSMAVLDPQKVAQTGFDIFATNGYLWSEFSRTAVPTHYVLSDPACFGANFDRMNEVQQKISMAYTPVIEKIHAAGMALFVPMEQWARLDRREKVVGFCDIENELLRNAADVTRPRGYYPLTAYKALAIALYLGYQTIYICGFDNDYFLTLAVDENNEIYYGDKVFFGDGKKRSVAREVGCVCPGEYLYEQHFVFSQLGKFPPETIVNLHKESLATYFRKAHTLDVYKRPDRAGSPNVETAAGA